MEAIKQYLSNQDFGGVEYDAHYQLLTWQESSLIGGFQTVQIALDPSANILFIEICQISISTDGLGGTISFRDKRLVTNLFTIVNNVSFWQVANFHYVINDTKFSLISTSATVQFALGFAPISKRKKLKK